LRGSLGSSGSFVRLAPIVVGGLLAFTALVATEKTARADVTSWFAVGGGLGIEKNAVSSTGDRAGALSLSVGVGSSPNAPLVVGGIGRMVTYFSLGTDLSIAARVASGGFARGDWGIAFDAGVVVRVWKDGDHGRTPLQAIVTLGMPWGPQVALGAQFLSLVGDKSTLGGVALLELDLLRLTVMRKGSTDAYWFNPSPAGGRDK